MFPNTTDSTGRPLSSTEAHTKIGFAPWNPSSIEEILQNIPAECTDAQSASTWMRWWQYVCAEDLESPAYDYWKAAGNIVVAHWAAEAQDRIARMKAETEDLNRKLRAAAGKKAHQLQVLLEKTQAAEASKDSDTGR